MNWFILSIIATLFLVVINFTDKYLLKKHAKDSQTAVKVLAIFSLLIAIIYWPFRTVTLDWNLVWPIIAGIIEIVYLFFYLRGIEKYPIAYVMPFFFFLSGGCFNYWTFCV